MKPATLDFFYNTLDFIVSWLTSFQTLYRDSSNLLTSRKRPSSSPIKSPNIFRSSQDAHFSFVCGWVHRTIYLIVWQITAFSIPVDLSAVACYMTSLDHRRTHCFFYLLSNIFQKAKRTWIGWNKKLINSCFFNTEVSIKSKICRITNTVYWDRFWFLSLRKEELYLTSKLKIKMRKNEVK